MYVVEPTIAVNNSSSSIVSARPKSHLEVVSTGNTGTHNFSTVAVLSVYNKFSGWQGLVKLKGR